MLYYYVIEICIGNTRVYIVRFVNQWMSNGLNTLIVKPNLKMVIIMLITNKILLILANILCCD